MKKLFVLFSIFISIVFSSCKKDDNALNSIMADPTGAWTLNKVYLDTLDITDQLSNYKKITLSIKEDKTFESRMYIGNGWAPSYGTWEISNDIITFKFDKDNGNKCDVTDSYNYIIGTNNLTLKGTSIVPVKAKLPDNYKMYIQEFSK
jgi:hypothetical protein